MSIALRPLLPSARAMASSPPGSPARKEAGKFQDAQSLLRNSQCGATLAAALQRLFSLILLDPSNSKLRTVSSTQAAVRDEETGVKTLLLAAGFGEVLGTDGQPLSLTLPADASLDGVRRAECVTSSLRLFFSFLLKLTLK